jgi:hypothetical protein
MALSYIPIGISRGRSPRSAVATAASLAGLAGTDVGIAAGVAIRATAAKV